MPGPVSIPPLKVLIVDDSALYRQTITNVLRDVTNVEIVGYAKTGAEALRQMEKLQPHVLTLDFEMPDLNGIEVLRVMQRQRSEVKAIMVSSHTEAGAQVTLDALMEGAFDFILKPVTGTPDENRRQLRESLIEKFMAIIEQQLDSGKPVTVSGSGSVKPDAKSSSPCRAVLIGTSTGGPVALRELLPQLPADFPVPVIVVQHMPATYVTSLAGRLNHLCALEVMETAEGQRIQPGTIHIAAGGVQTKLVRRGRDVWAQLTDDPPENSCRPAFDYLLRSAAEVYEGQALAVVLTGMGRDGERGCQVLKNLGGGVLAQQAESCAVYGMPRAVINAGLADQIVPLDRMAQAIQRFVKPGR